jgi:predicted PurR-regulated permease PerM
MLSAANSSNTQITRFIIPTVVIVIGLVAMWLVRDILMLTLTAAIFAILLTTPVRFFVRRGFRRPVAVLLTVALVIAFVALLVTLLLPGLAQQFGILIGEQLPAAAALLQEELQADRLIERFPFLEGTDVEQVSRELSSQLLGGIANVTAQALPLVTGLASALINTLIVLFLSVYFIADPGLHQRGLLKLFPLRYRPRAYEIMVKLDETMRRFLQAQILLMILTGLIVTGFLALLGVPLAGALGTITGLLSFVPNFGQIAALIPIIAVGAINTPDKVLTLIAIYFVVQFIIGQIVTPLLMGQGVNIAPALILISQIVSGVFFGFLGLLLAVPLAAIALVLVREIYIKDILGDVERPAVQPELDPTLLPDGV